MIAGCAGSEPDFVFEGNSAPPDSASYFQHDLALNQAIKGELESRALFSQTVYEGEPGFEFNLYGNVQSTVNVEGVPFARYWQLKDQEAYVFHPMVFGRYLCLNRANLPDNEQLLNTLPEFGYELEAGGLAFYYPEHFPLNRMKGPEITYSAISQSEILAGFSQNERSDSLVAKFERDALKALLNSYYHGGVNLADHAFLEMPLYRSAPEIILNGWLHALLHLNDYARLHEDSTVDRIVAQNCQFLARRINDWYDEANHISLYSNLTPYMGDLVFDKPFDPADTMWIEYVSEEPAINNQRIPVSMEDHRDFGSFDNLISQTDAGVKIRISASSLFRTRVVSPVPFTLAMQSGTYQPERAAPAGGGYDLAFKSIPEGRKWVAEIACPDSLLWRGFPTNFNKQNGKNYYHVQHIVGILYIANFGKNISEADRQKLIATADRWYRDTRLYSHLPIDSFEAPQKVLESMMEGKVIQDVETFDELLELSGLQPDW